MSKQSVAPAANPRKLPHARRPQPTTPHRDTRQAMADLAELWLDADALHASIEIHRSALVGALAEARELDVPAEDVGAFLTPILESLRALGERAGGFSDRLARTGRALLPFADQPHGKAGAR